MRVALRPSMRATVGLLLFSIGCASAPRAQPLPVSPARASDAEYAGALRVRSWGDPASPPLVLVHGLGERASGDFEPVADGLAQGFHVIALDLPGFGGSPAAGHSFHPSDFAELVARWMREELDGPAHLLGHSMGGAIAILVAGRHPELVERLVLVDVAGVLHREAFVGSQLGGAAHGPVGSLVGAVRRFEPDPAEIVSSPALRRAVLGESPGQVAALSLITTDVGPALSAIRAPTLLLWGQRDRIAPLRTAHLLDDRIAGSRLVVLERAGHVPMEDAPAAFVTRVRAHLLPDVDVPARPRADGAATDRVFRCEGQSDVELTGRYQRVELRGCRGVVIRDARIDALVVHHSDAVLDNVLLGGRGAAVALEARDANLRATGGAMIGEIGASISGSRLDLAGVEVIGSRVAFQTGAPSRVLFSVCVVRSGRGLAYPHGNAVLGG